MNELGSRLIDKKDIKIILTRIYTSNLWFLIQSKYMISPGIFFLVKSVLHDLTCIAREKIVVHAEKQVRQEAMALSELTVIDNGRTVKEISRDHG